MARARISVAVAVLLSALALPVTGASAAAGASSTPTVTVVASGLDNPRDLTVGPGGRVYVAEAGHGGPECAGDTCVGFSSGISRIEGSGAHRIVSGLASLAGHDGFGATGIDGVWALGNGTIYGIETAAAAFVPDGAFSPSTTAGLRAQLGRLVLVSPNGEWKAVADVGSFNYQWTTEHKSLVPDQYPDANPYGVYADERAAWVVDAGANTLDRVGRNGAISEAAWFPNPPSSDSVPTCVERGPDGALYVSELTGGGNAPGAANVYRVVPGQAPVVWARGLTAVTGCGFGADGAFYATEFSTNGLDNASPGTGAVVRVRPHSDSPEPVVTGLDFPGGFAAVGGSLYVSNWSIAPASSGGGPTGQVLRISL